MASSVGEEIACFLLTFTLAAISQLISKTISAPFERVKIVEQCERKVIFLETNFGVNFKVTRLNVWLYPKSLGAYVY